MFSIYNMVGIKIALAAALFAALSVAVTQLIQLTFIGSTVVNAAIEGLFVGTVVYFGLKTLVRSVDSQ